MNQDSGRGMAIAYGASVGVLIGALWALVDVTATTYYGMRIPWSWPIMVIAGYLFAGGLWGGVGSGITVVVARRRGTTSPERLRGLVREWLLAGWLLAAIGDICLTLVTAELTVLIGASLGAAYVLAATRRGLRIASRRAFPWQVLALAVLLVFWRGVRAAYDDVDPAAWQLHPSLAYGAFVAVVVVTYLAGAWLCGRAVWLMRVDTVAQCARHAGLAAVIGLLIGLRLVASDMTDFPLRPHPQPRAALADVRPNVILISLDTVRADHLSVYGYHRPTTPNLETLAREAVVYDLAISTSSWTLPAHASMLTGQLPSGHGAHYVEAAKSRAGVELADVEYGSASAAVAYRLALENVTLAEILSAHGYATAAIVSNAGALNHSLHMNQGFDRYDDRVERALRSLEAELKTPAANVLRFARGWVGWVTHEAARTAPEMNRDVVAWLDQIPPQPFFLFLNFNDAHTPYTRRPGIDLGPLEPPPGSVQAANFLVYPAYREKMITYDTELRYLDHHLGRLMSELKRRGLYDDSLIIVTADHGEGFGEHGWNEHGKSLYQQEVWVPLMVRYPGGAQCGRVTEPVSTARIFNMVLDGVGLADCGLRLAAGTSSTALSGDAGGLPGGVGPYGAEVVAELWPRWTKDKRPHPGGVMCAVVTPDGLKAIRNTDARVEAYDVARDPLEQEDLAGGESEFAAWSDPWLADWAEMMRATEPDATAVAELDDDMRERLRAMGYIQ